MQQAAKVTNEPADESASTQPVSPSHVPANNYDELPRAALIGLLREHDAALLESGRDGTGRAAPWQIIRQVKPRLSRILKKLSAGDETAQSQNGLWDGENLSAMVTLYKYRGQIDLVLTDPPYNTGEDFRYNDKWVNDPNDPELGEIVPKDDGSRHSKWLRFMTPRLWMMREMLRPGGVIAICIDHRELWPAPGFVDTRLSSDVRCQPVRARCTVRFGERTISSHTGGGGA